MVPVTCSCGPLYLQPWGMFHLNTNSNGLSDGAMDDSATWRNSRVCHCVGRFVAVSEMQRMDCLWHGDFLWQNLIGQISVTFWKFCDKMAICAFLKIFKNIFAILTYDIYIHTMTLIPKLNLPIHHGCHLLILVYIRVLFWYFFCSCVCPS